MIKGTELYRCKLSHGYASPNLQQICLPVKESGITNVTFHLPLREKELFGKFQISFSTDN
jgi:hypothetical protein